jgi:signal transduction histidine kinase
VGREDAAIAVPVLPTRLRSLSAKLALYFIALAFPALVLVQSTVATLEFRELLRELDAGALERAAARTARALAWRWARPEAATASELDAWLADRAMELSHPRGGLARDAAYVLLELSDRPLAVAVHAADGRRLGASVAGVSPPPPEALAAALAGASAARSADRAGRVVRHALVPIVAPDGARLGALHLHLDLPPPWRKLMLELGFEWPILFGYLVVFGIGSALFLGWYVTRRLGRIAAAAERWSAGDFASSIDDRSGDELGRLARDLERMAQQLAEHVRTRAQLASLEERQRLARDLHDTVKQKVFGLNLQLAAAQGLLERAPADALARLHDAQALVAEIQREMAVILHELRETGGEAPLAARAHRLAGDWSRRSGIAIEWTRCDAVEAPPALQDDVLRILEEALANAWRHSAAGRVALSLRDDDGQASLAVADDGRGFAAGSAGMGLNNMRERAARLPHGALRVDSQPGRGTRVEVTWRALALENDNAA